MERAQLQEELMRGGVDWAQWPPGVLEQLETELAKGEAELIKEPDGVLLRVVSVAKPVVVSPEDMVLIEVFQSFPDAHAKPRLNTIAEKFCASKESLMTAVVRAVAEEIRVADTSLSLPKEENPQVLVGQQNRKSVKYVGLQTRYNLYYSILPEGLMKEILKRYPATENRFFPVDELDGPNPKTMWWAWAPFDELKDETPFLKLLESPQIDDKLIPIFESAKQALKEQTLDTDQLTLDLEMTRKLVSNR